MNPIELEADALIGLTALQQAHELVIDEGTARHSERGDYQTRSIQVCKLLDMNSIHSLILA